MNDVYDVPAQQPKLTLRGALIRERESTGQLRASSTTARRLAASRPELLQDALTHQMLKALGEMHWDVSGVEDLRQVISDQFGHRDGPNKRPRVPAELRMYHLIAWADMRVQRRAAVVAILFSYLDVSDDRGQRIFGSGGWDVILAARDLLLSPPTTEVAWSEWTKRSPYDHPAIRRRVDSGRHKQERASSN